MSKRVWALLALAVVGVAAITQVLRAPKTSEHASIAVEEKPQTSPTQAPTVSPGPVASPSPVVVSANTMSPAEFRQLEERAKTAIPSVEQLNSLRGEAVHHVPAALVRAGAALGALAQAVHDHPELAPQAREFYGECSQEGTYPVQVRALCFSHVRDGSVEVPAEVKALADKIPKT